MDRPASQPTLLQEVDRKHWVPLNSNEMHVASAKHKSWHAAKVVAVLHGSQISLRPIQPPSVLVSSYV